MTAPDLYGLDNAQLADEMESVTVAHQMRLNGTVTIITGVRRDRQPVLVIQSLGGVHYIALPGDD